MFVKKRLCVVLGRENVMKKSQSRKCATFDAGGDARNISKTSYVVDEYMHVPRKKTPKENPMYLSRKSRLSHWAVVSHWAVNDCRARRQAWYYSGR